MPVINPGEVWITDFGMAAEVRPALLLTGSPADDELDVVTLLLSYDGPARQPLGVEHPKTVSQTGCVSLAASPNGFDHQAGAQARLVD